ncbi:MAG TPA: hypothetical protein VHE12_00415 [bacterium]|nr:hypothetical protein [bacterium]
MSRSLVLALALLGWMTGCGPKPAGDGQKPVVPLADYTQARNLANAVASDLLQQDMKDLFQRLDPGFHMVVKDEKELGDHIGQMDKIYGRLLDFQFKASETGLRQDGVWRRASRSFLYATKTTKYTYGKYFLRIEVVPAYDGRGPIVVSGFGYFTFKDGIVPENLK